MATKPVLDQIDSLRKRYPSLDEYLSTMEQTVLWQAERITSLEHEVQGFRLASTRLFTDPDITTLSNELDKVLEPDFVI